MFARVTDSSKTALVGLSTLLTNWEYHFIDCQVRSSHLDSLGAKCIPRNQFSKMLERAIQVPVAPHHWTHSKAGSELL